jgi:hypothetical protein
MNKQLVRYDFVDWMKAIGMFLIVFGHFFGEPYNQLTQPVYPKQLGVAIFVFIMGWGLGNTHQAIWHAAYKRIFPMFFWGGVIAVFISAISFFMTNDLRLSNYMPFVFGVNVGFNFFPSNQTTWFIGTYLHIIFLWAIFFNKLTVTPTILGASLVFEILIRAVLIHSDNLFTAYMIVPSWLTVFLLGMYMRDMKDSPTKNGLPVLIIIWAGLTALWATLLNSLNVGSSFPFRGIQISSDKWNALFESICISALYLGHTFFFVKVFSKIKANNLVRFFARNTIIVFIAHMPFYVVAAPIATIFVPSGWGKRLIIVLLMYVGLSALSELLNRLVKVDGLKDFIWKMINPKKHEPI